jgi:hypothetical protein
MIIYSNAVDPDPVADFGIYASSTLGYMCVDSFGNTNQSGVGVIPSWADIAAASPTTKLCQ